MKKIAGFKKIIFVLLMFKKLNNNLTNNFNILREKKLTSLANKVERKFV